MNFEDKDYIVVTGPTASGKSSLAHRLALKHNGEIINCDSVQMYRMLDIGSAKVSKAEQAEVNYHLLDMLNPDETYDANRFRIDCLEKIGDIKKKGRLPIVVGGTGLYLRALWQDRFERLPTDATLRNQLEQLTSETLRKTLLDLNPERAAEIHPNDRYRHIRAVEIATLIKDGIEIESNKDVGPDYTCFKIYLNVPRKILHERIAQRAKIMLNEGLIAETELILDKYSNDLRILQSIGYKQVVEFLNAKIAKSDLEEKIIVATRQYAKRQETWFRKVAFDEVIEPLVS